MADETQAEAEAEVVLTPFLQQVMERAKALGFKAEAVPVGSSGGEPWVSIDVPPCPSGDGRPVFGHGTISVFSESRNILAVQTQEMPAVALVQEARRVADAARLILDVDAPKLPGDSLRMDIVRDGADVEVQVEVEDGEIGRARLTDDARTEVTLTRTEEREAEELWLVGRQS